MPFRFLLAVILVLAASVSLPAVVISELYYNPRPGDESLEFVEVANELSTPEDISAYTFSNGIEFTFPPRTILPGRGFIVVALDTDAVKARYGITNVFGNYTGRLDASGERLTLLNHQGVVVQSLRYRDEDKWPVEPDGTGHTLAIKNPRFDSSEPESWAPSTQLGGTPGTANFPSSGGPVFEERVIVDRGASWRYQKGTQAFSNPATAWRESGFNDAAWPEGPSGFGYGDADDATELTDMEGAYLTVAIRKHVTLTADDLARTGDFALAINFDDGFCAFVNGQEIVRFNCGTPGADLAFNDVATNSREAGPEDVYTIPKNLLRAGDNVFAIVGHNFSLASSDFSLIPRLLHRRLVTTEAPGTFTVVFNELFRGAAVGEGWVELYNQSASAVDLSGYTFTDDPARPDPEILPAGSILPGRGFLVIQEATIGLTLSAPEVRLFLISPSGLTSHASVFDREPPPSSTVGAYSECRYPDGGTIEWVTLTPTIGAANQVPRVTDIVINEIFYHPPERVDPVPELERLTGEFLELHNKADVAIDVSGFRFDKGINYVIPAGTLIAAGGYLVIAEDPAIIAARYVFSGALGPYEGQLANDGESIRLRDAAGNTVDEVRYAEGGDWSAWADGGGSSLELIDPKQDNAVGSAWDASDESAKSVWEKLSFQVPSYAAAGASELHLYMVGRSQCYVDDISIVPTAGGANFIPNPGFETNTLGWTIEGTHIDSRRVTSDKHSGVACLEINASGKGNTLINRLEIETSPRLAAAARYDVSLWARWQRGANVLITHGEFTAGSYGGRPGPATNLSGNSLSAPLRMTIPLNLGTPGAENSARRNLRTQSGSDNLGPVISNVRQTPVSPAPNEPVKIAVRITDSASVTNAVLNHRDGALTAGAFLAAQLYDDGAHDDAGAGDGLWGGELPAGSTGARRVFYVEARDPLNAVRRYPVDAPARTLVYQVQGPLSGIDSGRMILDAANQGELEGRQLHSQDLVNGAFVFNNEEIYYNVGIRYRGSPWGRPGRSNFRVKFEEDKPFVKGRKKINLDNSGAGPVEGACYFLIQRNQGPLVRAPSCEYQFLRTYYNGADINIHGLLEPIDRDFVSAWYGETNGAVVYKVEGRRQFDDAGGLAGWDGASFVHRGPNQENYRDYFYQGMRRSVDPWQEWIALTRVMDTATTPAATFDATINDVLNVEAYLRVFAPRVLFSDWDAFSIGNGHNAYMIYAPDDGRWQYLAFDMDNNMGGTPSNLFPNYDPYVLRMIQRPWPRRLYYRILWEYANGYGASVNAGPYFDAVQRDTGIGMSGIRANIDAAGSFAKSQVLSSTTTAFKITTNSGNDITTDKTSIQLQGDAPVTLASIFYTRNDSDTVELQPIWTTHTRWQMTFELPEAQNTFEFLGFSAEGQILGSTQITVTSSVIPSGPVVNQMFPITGGVTGGALITFTGSGFVPGLQVFFGGIASPRVTILGGDVVQAVTPPATFPLPADAKVDVEVVATPTARTKLSKAFTYTAEGGFVRGDVTFDLKVDLGDAIATLFHLYGGTQVLCLDAADTDDNGAVNLTDVIASLNYLFQSGAAPKAPFPGQGQDLTADGLVCTQ